MKLRTLFLAAAAGLSVCTVHAQDAIKAVSFTTTAGVTSADAKYFTIEMDNSQPIWAYELKLTLPAGMEIDTSKPLELNTTRYPLSGDTYEHQFTCDKQKDGSWRIIVHTDETNRIKGTSGEILKVHYTTSGEMVDGNNYEINIKDAVMCVNKDNSIIPDASAATMTLGIIPGDANGDGSVTVADVVAIISYILGDTPDNFITEAANVNDDNVITIADAVKVLDMVSHPQ